MESGKIKHPLFTIDQKSMVPLHGLDFLGIVDRGTNVLEIKPHTICQFRCKYCFVSAGAYHNNFTIEPTYLNHWINKAIDLKDCDDIELHFAPYGEIFLYKPFVGMIKTLKKISKIRTISAQTNGVLLNENLIEDLEEAGLDRINISLNSMDADLCAELCGIKKYDLDHLLHMMDLVLDSKIDLCIAPVWFMGKNDEGIFDIIEFVRNKIDEGYKWPNIIIGIQNYLE